MIVFMCGNECGCVSECAMLCITTCLVISDAGSMILCMCQNEIDMTANISPSYVRDVDNIVRQKPQISEAQQAIGTSLSRC